MSFETSNSFYKISCRNKQIHLCTLVLLVQKKKSHNQSMWMQSCVHRESLLYKKALDSIVLLKGFLRILPTWV